MAALAPQFGSPIRQHQPASTTTTTTTAQPAPVPDAAAPPSNIPDDTLSEYERELVSNRSARHEFITQLFLLINNDLPLHTSEDDQPTKFTAKEPLEAADSSSLIGFGALNGSAHSTNSSGVRPYYGDAFFSFQQVYWPIHCVICLLICTLGIFANVTNIIVLTRPNMITAVNTILSAMAFSDLIVNISNIPYLMHELSDSSNATSFFSFHWAVYILFHAHTTVTAHTISIWLTCVLATWRYFVVCRSQSSNQRNWSVGLAKRTITGVFLLVPLFCIPNYLSFAIVSEPTESNATIYKVGFSHLADESQFIKTFHFWIFSCLTKLVPCVLLIFFTTVLIRKLLDAKQRRLRLATYGGNNNPNEEALNGSADAQRKCSRVGGEADRVIVNGLKQDSVKSAHLDRLHHFRSNLVGGNSSTAAAATDSNEANPLLESTASKPTSGGRKGKVQISSRCATVDAELMMEPTCHAGNYDDLSTTNGQQQQQHQPTRILSQLIVESSTSGSSNATTVTTTAPTKMLASCDNDQPPIHKTASLAPNHRDSDPPRSASTCGNLELYGGDIEHNKQHHDAATACESNMAASQDFLDKSSRVRRSLALGLSEASLLPGGGNLRRVSQEKRTSDVSFVAGRARSVGGSLAAPMSAKMQAAQRQISQNETTTRLLIAVMIVFLICELPAGIMAALCAIYGEKFFENVYQPTGTLTDLLALINSSVNFILYCFMSTQFRITFYRVVLHCPAPNASQHTQAMLLTTNQNVNKVERSPKPAQHQQNRELNNY